MTSVLDSVIAPPEWRATKLRSFLTRRKQTNRSGLHLLSVNLPKGVVPRQEGDGRTAPSLDLSGYQEARPNDLVMNQLGKPHGALGVSDHHGIISPAYFVAEISNEAVPRFVHHLLRTRLYISEYERRGKCLPPSQFDISWEQFRDIPVALPSLPKQQQIADYLDTETARIDTLISKKRRLIGLLAEYRTALITQTVTHGLPPASASRQDFEELPIRRVFEVVNGGTPTSSEENWNGDVEWATPADLATAHGDILRSTARTLTLTGLHQGSNFVPANSLIVSTRAPIGYVCETTSRMAFNQGCRGLVPRCNVDLRFFRHQLSVMDEQLQALGQGSTFMELSTPTLASVLIAVPELDEQRVIADYLDTETAHIDALSSREEAVIKLLKEYRMSLITAAVTGQVSVEAQVHR